MCGQNSHAQYLIEEDNNVISLARYVQIQMNRFLHTSIEIRNRDSEELPFKREKHII